MSSNIAAVPVNAGTPVRAPDSISLNQAVAACGTYVIAWVEKFLSGRHVGAAETQAACQPWPFAPCRCVGKKNGRHACVPARLLMIILEDWVSVAVRRVQRL